LPTWRPDWHPRGAAERCRCCWTAANFDTIRDADLPPGDVERILSGNARDVLNLQLPIVA
jgi:hypothetical protein